VQSSGPSYRAAAPVERLARRGHPADALERIFEHGSRDGAEGRRYVQGAGLGLAIARQIVQAHGGQIWAESTLGQGSTIHVVLPVAQTRAIGPGRAGADD
jgi:signal transduction histidine kinase